MGKAINNDFATYSDFIADIPSGMFVECGEVLHDGRNCVKLFQVDGQKFVVKRFRQPNLFNRIVYTFFRGSKARRAYNNAFRLQQEGVQTPTPISYSDSYNSGLLSYCYLITEYTDWEPVLKIAFEPEETRRVLMDEFIKFTADLHVRGICHKDYNSTNALYRINGEGKAEFMLIDINRMSFGNMTKGKCYSCLARLCNTPETITATASAYAKERGWNVYETVAGLSKKRQLFERKKRTSGYFKDLIRARA